MLFFQNMFIVRVGSNSSVPRRVTSGSPQKGVLPPTLFSIYTFELSHLALSANQNVVLLPTTSNYTKTAGQNDHSALQNAINSVYRRSKQWEIPLSEEKTKLMHIGYKSHCHDYVIAETSMDAVGKTKDLDFFGNRRPEL